MRYIKVLLLAIVFFLALVFFFQNQGPLSQDMVLTLHLFFIPPMHSIPTELPCVGQAEPLCPAYEAQVAHQQP